MAWDTTKVDGTDYVLANDWNTMAATIKVAYASTASVTSELSYSYRDRPWVNMGRIGANAKPTVIERGAYSMFSLPIYNNDDEEIYFVHSLPRRWDGASDILFGCVAALATANTNKKFRLQLSWEHHDEDGIIPSTTNDVNFNQTTGTASQYQCYLATWALDYDIDGVGNELKSTNMLGIRLRRIAAADNEITGEVLVYGFYIQYIFDKLGASV